MKRTNGTDHTSSQKSTLDQKLMNIYGKPVFEKKSDDRFKCIHAMSDRDDVDGYEFNDSTTDDDEFCD